MTTLGLPQYAGLAAAFSILLVVTIVLMAVLARLVRDIPGPRWWGAGAACGLIGMWLAGPAMQATSAAARATYVLGELVLLASVASVIEGMRRYAGAPRSFWHWGVALGLGAAVCVPAEWFDRPVLTTTAVSALAAWLWLWAGWTSLRHTRRGFHPLFLGVAACTAVEAAGWALRGLLILREQPAGLWSALGGADISAVVVSANGWLVGVVFVATGALVMLYVLLVTFQLAERLRAQAVRDPLTGALNRRGFEDRTGRLASLSAQLGQSVALLVIDVDHFKAVNDTHGHHVGDLVLKALAQLVHRAKRETDIFARLGGEEFCLVLPGTDVPGARVFADRLRRSFETLEIDTGRSFLSCTMSVGVAYASARELALGQTDAVDLLRHADEALYEAKRAGRNRVRFYASPEVVSSKLDSRLFASTSSLPFLAETTQPMPDLPPP